MCILGHDLKSSCNIEQTRDTDNLLYNYNVSTRTSEYVQNVNTREIYEL